MSISEDLKNLNAVLNSTDEQIKLMEDLVDSTLTITYGVNSELKNIISKMTQEEIDSITSEDFKSKINSEYDELFSDACVESLNEFYEAHKNEPEYADVDLCYRKIFTDIKSMIDSVEKMKSQRNELVSESDKITNNYFEYINSAEYKQKKLDRINELKENAEHEDDIIKKNSIIRMLSIMENTETLDFLFERINKYGDKEIKSIKDTYFDSNRSNIVMKKFKARLPRYGYNQNLYKMFFNIEEKFLPEEYHDLNNIFLFHVMRYMSCTDTYNDRDNKYVSSVLIKMYNLLYHKYETTEMENEFIEVIKRVDDYFMPFIEYFKLNNITSPNHPHRITRDREYEEKRRAMIISSLQNEGIEPDTNLDTSELYKMLQDVIEDKSKTIVEDATDAKSSKEVLEAEHSECEEIEETDESDTTVVGITSESEPEMVVQRVTTVNNDASNSVVHEASLNLARGLTHPVLYLDEPKVEEIEVLMDKYGCYYVEDHGTYGYCESDGTVIEEGITQDTILHLMAVDALTKKTIKI